MTSYEYNFSNPIKIIAGKHAAIQLSFELDQHGSKRPFILTDQTSDSLLNKLIDAFRCTDITIGAVYAAMPATLSETVLSEILDVYSQSDCDAIIAMGGDYVIDAAKMIILMVSAETTDLSRFSISQKDYPRLKPFVAIPLSVNAALKISQPANLKTEKNTLVTLPSPDILPHIALIDPRLSIQLHAETLALEGMAAMGYAIDSLISLKYNPVSEAFAHTSIRILKTYLIKAVKKKGKKNLGVAILNGALIAGIAGSNTNGGLIQALSTAVNNVGGISKHTACSILLPHCMRYNIKETEDTLSKLAFILAGPEEASLMSPELRGERTITVLQQMLSKLNELCAMPTTLSYAGLPQHLLEPIAANAIEDPALTLSPKPVNQPDAIDILSKAF